MQGHLMSLATQPEDWVTNGMKISLSDLCHTTLLWFLHVHVPWDEILLSEPIWDLVQDPAQGGNQQCLPGAKPLQSPWQMEAAGAAEVLARTVLFMVGFQSVVTLNSLWDCPGLVSQCNSAQGLPI